AAGAGRTAEAEPLLERSLALRGAADPHGSADDLACLAALAYQRGDYDRSRALYEESLALERATGDPLEIATALTRLGATALVQGDYDAAEAAHRESLAISRHLKHMVGV